MRATCCPSRGPGSTHSREKLAIELETTTPATLVSPAVPAANAAHEAGTVGADAAAGFGSSTYHQCLATREDRPLRGCVCYAVQRRRNGRMKAVTSPRGYVCASPRRLHTAVTGGGYIASRMCLRVSAKVNCMCNADCPSTIDAYAAQGSGADPLSQDGAINCRLPHMRPTSARGSAASVGTLAVGEGCGGRG